MPAKHSSRGNVVSSRAGTRATLTKPQYLDLYYYMKLNRMVEQQLTNLYRQGKVVGGLYSSLGQEAISVGCAYALDKEDYLAPMIRNQGAVLVKGYRPRDLFTQYMARATGPTGGRDSSSHLGDLTSRKVVAPISMLGDLIPVMAGIALAGRYLGKKIVALTWIGEGGSSTGAFHEGLNFAAVQRLPVVVVLENNQWAYSTPVSRQSLLKDFADKAKACGIPGIVVDGNDVLAVHRVAKEAVDRARAGDGPTLIEAKTMRMKGHAEHDDASYVPKPMFEEWKKRDPIEQYERFLVSKKIMTVAEKEGIVGRIEREIQEDLDFAEKSPFPDPATQPRGVYCEAGCHEIRPEWAEAVKKREAEAVVVANNPVKRGSKKI